MGIRRAVVKCLRLRVIWVAITAKNVWCSKRPVFKAAVREDSRLTDHTEVRKWKLTRTDACGLR